VRQIENILHALALIVGGGVVATVLSAPPLVAQTAALHDVRPPARSAIPLEPGMINPRIPPAQRLQSDRLRNITNGVILSGSSSVRPPAGAVNLGGSAVPGNPLDRARPGPPNTLGPRSISDFWRTFRRGALGHASSDTASPQAVRALGQDWRLLRVDFLLKYLGWVPLGVLALLAVYHLLRGPMRLPEGPSGKRMPRFTINQRVAHWLTAGVFLFLALTGLLIFFARALVLPLIGHDANSVMLSASLQGHNLFGPLFIVALFWIFIKFLRGNFLQWADIVWILKLGGFFGGHVSSNKFNFGEKAWFWLLVLAGAVMAITGLALLFPWVFALYPWALQLAIVAHVLGAITLISVALGHIYVGSLGMEGAIDSMLIGHVDEAWAKHHHDLWLKEAQAAEPPETKGASA